MHLVPGGLYEVISEFVDFDRVAHPSGERWTFLGSAFLPHDDGLSLFVSLDGQAEWHIRLQWRLEDQGPIIEHLKDYIRAAD
jgi:hypothetical protein